MSTARIRRAGAVRANGSRRRILIGETKTEHSHRALALGLLTPVFRELRRKAKLDDYVFQMHGAPIDDRYLLRRHIRPAAERLGLYFTGFGWRTFRRLNIAAIQDGPDAVNVFEAMRQAGHTKPETTMRYTLARSERRDEAILGLQGRWFTGAYGSSGSAVPSGTPNYQGGVLQ